MLFVYLLLAGGLAYAFSDIFLWVGIALAVTMVMMPVIAVGTWVIDNTYVTNLVFDSLGWISGLNDINDMWFSGQICPNGSYANAGGLASLLTIVPLTVFVTFLAGVTVAFLLAVLPGCVFIVVSAASTIVTRKPAGVLAASLTLIVGSATVLVLGSIIRLVHVATLAMHGC